MKPASDQMRTHYDRMANHEGDDMLLFRPTQIKRKSPKVQSPWDSPYRVVTWINNVVYSIQRRNPRSRIMVIYLEREQLESNHCEN
jgi:hypothetical protein